MRPRLVLLALATLAAMATVACGSCSWGARRAQREVVKVRWPPTAPVVPGQTLSRNEQAENVPDDLLTETDVAPGVRVREGRAHDLTYFEIVLGDADFDDPLPLVVLLHGRGDRPRIPGGPFSGVPTPMRLVIPRAPLRLGAGFAWVSGSVTQDSHLPLARSLLTRTHHLAALIGTLYRTLPTLGRPVVAGFSQGAMLTFSLALHRPDVVGRAFSIAGWVPPDLMPQLPAAPELRIPIRSIHGTDDAVIPIAPTREAVAMLRALGWDIDLMEFEGIGHLVSPEMNATFETWLEEALREQAPGLIGRGLGTPGPEGETYEPFEPLEQETIEAIEQLDLTEPVPPESENDVPPNVIDPGAPEIDTEQDGTPDAGTDPR